MLPMNLLRAKVVNKGKNIIPIFCCWHKDSKADPCRDLELAANLIDLFKRSALCKQKKSEIRKEIEVLESQFDYKLVRGLQELLERRCIFNTGDFKNTYNYYKENRHLQNDFKKSGSRNYHLPFVVRKAVFEESSLKGFALTDSERTEILNKAASNLHIPYNEITDIMWSDLEENWTIEQFDPISPEQLISWYNLSVVQTLLFNCTNLEFSISGGQNWKQVLRNVKRFGLMYNMQYAPSKNHIEIETKKELNSVEESEYDSADTLICSIDGPMSLFKLTDRYGTSIAKLFPFIIKSKKWFVKATVVRKTMSGKKLYDFALSESDSPPLLNPDMKPAINAGDGEGNSRDKRTLSSPSSSSSSTSSPNVFDSKVEEKFAQQFEKFDTGWKLIREPGPLKVSDGRALIPDFMFTRYGRSVYLEIVGFWTRQYLERKIEKLADIIAPPLPLPLASPPPALKGYGRNEKNPQKGSIEFLIAINSDLVCSNLDLIPGNKIILYKNDTIPMKPILEFLKNIDTQMIKIGADSRSAQLEEELVQFGDTGTAIIKLKDMSDKYNIPTGSIEKIILDRAKHKSRNMIPYTVVGEIMILKSKLKELDSMLLGNTRFNDTCDIIIKNGIPEQEIARVLSVLGYEVIWNSLDPNTATVRKRDGFILS